MARQILGRSPHRFEDARLREVLKQAPARITSGFTAEIDPDTVGALGSYGVRMVVLAMRERRLDLLHEGLLAMALPAAADADTDDRDLMVALALPYVAAVQLGVKPTEVFAATAARFDDGWMPDLLRAFGARTDVTLAAFGWRQIMTPDGLDVIPSYP